MGREAECNCDWNGTSEKVRALIEPPELILRGQLRRRIPFPEIQQVRVEGEKIRFDVGPDSVALHLGYALAVKWVQYLTAPPPSLANKLGITADTAVRMIGKADDDALFEALAAAQSSADTGPGDLILARVNTPQELFGAFKAAADQLGRGVPIWFIYPKGKDHPLTENEIRAMALAIGIVDTKVAAVSEHLTALRFVKRRKA